MLWWARLAPELQFALGWCSVFPERIEPTTEKRLPTKSGTSCTQHDFVWRPSAAEPFVPGAGVGLGPGKANGSAGARVPPGLRVPPLEGSRLPWASRVCRDQHLHRESSAGLSCPLRCHPAGGHRKAEWGTLLCTVTPSLFPWVFQEVAVFMALIVWFAVRGLDSSSWFMLGPSCPIPDLW